MTVSSIYIIDTIFIGGGTPSILSVENMKILFNEIDKLNKSLDVEYSMECNPGSLNEKKLKTMKENTNILAKPFSTKNICEIILK